MNHRRHSGAQRTTLLALGATRYSSVSSVFQRWVGYAACTWAVFFAAPHVWWLLGVRKGFPGGDASYEFFMSSSWRVAFDLLVVVLSVAMVLITRALMRPMIPASRRRTLSTLAWMG